MNTIYAHTLDQAPPEMWEPLYGENGHAEKVATLAEKIGSQFGGTFLEPYTKVFRLMGEIHDMGKTYGYIRVSSTDQNELRQCIALQEKNIPKENIFIDKVSGKDFQRPQYCAMLKRLKAGDQICITSIDRLGRNYKEIQQQWHILTKEMKVDILVLDMPLLDTRRDKDLLGTFIADLVLQVLSFVAQSERENIRKRQAEGIAAAKSSGIRFGRTPSPLPSGFSRVYALWKEGKINTSEAARRCGMARSSFRYRADSYARKNTT